MRVWPDLPMTAMPRGFCFVKGQRHAVIMAKTEYALEPGVLGPGPDALEDAVKILLEADDPAGEPDAGLVKASEQAPTKLKADVLLFGSAHTPGGEPVSAVRTLLRVTRSNGEAVVDKEIDVLGDRIWLSDGTRSDIEPFVEMPLTWDRAFGGPGDRRNPAGCGQRGDALPNLEVPDRHVTGRADKTPATCYGAVNPAWKPRSDKTGSYGPDYVEKHWPWLPGDFDWSHFNGAPDDQQVEGFLRGDETIELRHLVKGHEEFKTALRGERCRAFVLIREPDGSETFREVEMVLDTLTILPDEGKVTVCWRGQTDSRSLKLLEFEQLMLVREALDEPDKGLSHFRERLRGYENRPHDVFLSEEAAAEVNAAMEEADRAQADAEQQIAEAKKRVEEEKAKAEAHVERLRDEGLMVPDIDWDAKEIPASRYDQVNAAIAGIDQGVEQLKGMDLGGEAVNAKLDEMAVKRAELEAQRPFLKAEHQRPTRDELEAAAAAGEPMHNRDLGHVDLRGAKLAGIDLTGSLMEETDLAEADLTGAVLRECTLIRCRMTGATLRGADLSGLTPVECDLSGADLTEANLDKIMLPEAKLARSSLARASLNEAILAQSDLNHSDFAGCRAEGVILFGSDLTAAVFDDAEMPRAILMETTLEDASLFRADLRRAVLAGSKAARACFVAADMANAMVSLKADLTEADLRLINGNGATFQGSTLDDAWFGGAELARSIFAESSMKGTEMVCVHAPASDFSDAIIEETDFTHSNLFRCMFDRAEMTRVHFEGASLFQSGFCESVIDTLFLADTNLKRTMLDNPSRSVRDEGANS
ncbi:MAG: DUF2169 domain-containing protein [Planctomycetota bacterium]